ncbi:MAG: peptidoglycan DD-metalloendopeptidase family protein [Candidatus Promineifilaceae bacterium]
MTYPVIRKGSKVGIHALQASSFRWVEEAVRRGITWPVVKSVGDVAWLARVKDISPNTITVARVAHNDDGKGEGLTGIEFVNNGDYSNYVDMLFGTVLTQLRNNPQLRDKIDYWEVSNEPDPPDIADSLNSPADLDGYRKLAECMIACMEKAEAHGIKLALFALNAGTPEWHEIEAMIATGVFKRAQQGKHIISVHEGIFKDEVNRRWGPVDQWYGGAIPSIDQSNPQTGWVQLDGRKINLYGADKAGLSELPKDRYTAGPLCFRYRYWLQRLRDVGQVVPFLVSEIRLGATNTYNTTLPWYDKHAAEDAELLGFLPFTWSPYLGGDTWGDADMDTASEVVLTHMKKVQNRVNATQSAAPAPPVTPPTPPVNPPKPPVNPPKPPVTPPTPPNNSSIADAFKALMADPSRLKMPAQRRLQNRVIKDGRRIVSNEIRTKIDGVDSIMLLAADKTYQSLVMYYVNYSDWRADAIKIFDPTKVEPPRPPITHKLEAWPTTDRIITQEFGARPAFYSQFGLPAHEGVDIHAPLGSEIRAVYGGRVIHMGKRKLSDKRQNSNYGWHAWVQRSNGERWVYGHLNEDIRVATGQTIEAGALLGFSGNSGRSNGPHLHLGLQIPSSTADDKTDYPFDFVDPTSRLLPLGPQRPYKGGYLEYRRSWVTYPTAIDTSMFRPNIKWGTDVKLNPQGVYCVMPRASSGITEDPDFVPTMIQLTKAKQNGERVVIIPFHDINPRHSADAQADVFQKQISKFGGWRAWMFDVEPVPSIGRPLPTEAQVGAFVEAVERRIGVRPKLYYSRTSLINRVSKTNTFGADLMLAAYGARNPRLPACYEAIDKTWTFHQFTDNYTLKGYTSTEAGKQRHGVDQSYFQGTIKQLFEWEAHQPKQTAPPASNPTPPKPPQILIPADRINLLPYWKGKQGWAHNLRSFTNGNENNETVQTVLFENGEWGIVKNQAMQRYFLREYEGRMFIWQGPDTSPGNGRFYATFINKGLGAPVCPVEMAVGEEWHNSRPHYVQFYQLANGQPSAPNSGVATNWIKLHNHYPSKTFNGIMVNDVIEIGNNEIHLLARDRTLVGWSRQHDDPHTPQSAGLSEIHKPFTRTANPLPVPHFDTPDAARPF